MTCCSIRNRTLVCPIAQAMCSSQCRKGAVECTGACKRCAACCQCSLVLDKQSRTKWPSCVMHFVPTAAGDSTTGFRRSTGDRRKHR